MLNKIWIIVSMFSVILLSLIIPTNLYSYGQLAGEAEDNQSQSLVDKYGSTEEKLRAQVEKSKIEMEQLMSDCTQAPLFPNPDLTIILLLDKCKPLIKMLEDIGWHVGGFYESKQDEIRREDIIRETIYLYAPGTTGLLCLKEIFKEHILIDTYEGCQRVIQYYLNNGYDLVDKNDENVELIKRQNSSQVNP